MFVIMNNVGKFIKVRGISIGKGLILVAEVMIQIYLVNKNELMGIIMKK